MLKNDDRTLRITQSLKIKWRIWLLVCRFGNLVAPVLVAAHSVNNLGLRDEPEDEKKETEKLWRDLPEDYNKDAFFVKMYYLILRIVIKKYKE